MSEKEVANQVQTETTSLRMPKKYRQPRKEAITSFPEKEKKIYLRNADLMQEIQNVKMTFCEILDNKYTQPHGFVKLGDKFDSDNYYELFNQAWENAKTINPEIPMEDVVIRVMTYEHIPKDPTRKKKANSVASEYKKISFHPFKQFILVNGNLKEVVRSHWKGDFDTGEFCAYRGQLSNKLAIMWDLLIDKLGEHPRFRMYSYINEMKSEAREQIVNVGLQFNEAVSSNPFSFYTTTIINCFKKIRDEEKQAQNLRDDLLIASGACPSFTRQVEHEYAYKSNKFYKDLIAEHEQPEDKDQNEITEIIEDFNKEDETDDFFYLA